jgi:23S rRNA (cytidine1920-2'-O)/16S rRNA (cytidine1409-2'-O)-methyltransferase
MVAARLDAEIVRRGLARSRTRAASLVSEGRVTVDGVPARKPAQAVTESTGIDVGGDVDEDVSRGSRKLTGALDELERLAPGALDLHGRRCLDAGASTGGFTQVLLRRGALHVLAVDVGHGQLDPALARDPRVTAVEGVNVRDLDLGGLPTPAGQPSQHGATEPVDVVVGDLSFISLRMVLEPLVRATRPGGHLVLLVKPQFEVGRERLGRGGVVTSPQLRADAVVTVARAMAERGVAVRAVVPSSITGESGNQEYFLWGHVRAGGPADPRTAGLDTAAVRGAVFRTAATLLEDGPDGPSGRTGAMS